LYTYLLTSVCNSQSYDASYSIWVGRDRDERALCLLLF
jgi:hypothetical protein